MMVDSSIEVLENIYRRRQAPLTRAVIDGLTTSTAIPLILIPVAYTLFRPDMKANKK